MQQVDIVFTGGGTAGHVTPNIALIEAFQKDNLDLAYIGSKTGIEKNLISALDVSYYPIETGKFRRYLTWQHLIEPFKIIYGFFQSFFLLRKLKPRVVFSKGGFVSFPVVISAWLLKIPVVSHESDMTPGLANRMTKPFVQKFCVNFEATTKHFKNQNLVFVTGTPIRQSLLLGNKQKALSFTGFTKDKPTLMVIGGSLGAKKINKMIRKILPKLLENHQVIHICGKGNLDLSLNHLEGYRQYEFVKSELGDLFALSDVVISRSGANALCELLTLAKPHLLIPLSKQASRGDQLDNAATYAL
jgi:UDP-N-acetylglucosamine--N-acetylmuramyl-(pentapeptide) pyrophosphoryl-undecaprenol N-acetylglucosamine transferase